MDIGVHSQGVAREETIQDRGVEKVGSPRRKYTDGLYCKSGLRLASEIKAVLMMKKISYCFLFLLVFSVCSEEKDSLLVVSDVKKTEKN